MVRYSSGSGDSLEPLANLLVIEQPHSQLIFQIYCKDIPCSVNELLIKVMLDFFIPCNSHALLILYPLYYSLSFPSLLITKPLQFFISLCNNMLILSPLQKMGEGGMKTPVSVMAGLRCLIEVAQRLISHGAQYLTTLHLFRAQLPLIPIAVINMMFL